MLITREEAEARERNHPLLSGRLRTYSASGSPPYAFNGEWWFGVGKAGKRSVWTRCTNVPLSGLWVAGHISRALLGRS